MQLAISTDGVREIASGTGLVDADVVTYRTAGEVPSLGADIAAATQLVTRRAAAALAAAPATGSVEVVGDGVLANAVRASRAATSTEPLAAIIDTTGDAAKIVEALHRLPAGGTLVLASWPPQAAVNVDPYIDLHRPGVLVTTPKPTDTSIDVELPGPVDAAINTTLPAGTWFHIAD